MARDIEEFLRRAAERRKQQQNKQRGPATSERVREIVENEEVEVVQPVEIVKPRKKRQTRSSLARETQEKQKRDLRQQSISEHVQSHIDSSDIAEHAEHLGDRIQSADDRIAARLKRKFSHDVSKIDDMPTVQDDEVATVTIKESSKIAVDLINMLRDPQNVRQSILISEILKRPDFDR